MRKRRIGLREMAAFIAIFAATFHGSQSVIKRQYRRPIFGRIRQGGAMTSSRNPSMRTTMFAASMAVLATYTLSAIADPPPRLRVLGTYESGLFNAGSATVDVLDLRHPSVPTKVTSLDIVADLAPRSVGAANSVDTRFGILVVAVEADPKQDDGHYVLAANEGDARDYNGGGDFDKLFALGGCSFSIWNATTGALVFDSGAELEQLLANLLPDDFNTNHEENDSFDNRSDNKGPEPEGVTLGKVKGKLYAFVGLERIGGILVLDLSDPKGSSSCLPSKARMASRS